MGRWRHRTHERDTVMNGPGPPTILPPSALHGKTTVAVTAERSFGSALGQRLTHLTTPRRYHQVQGTLGAVHFEVLALPNRITSRICAPLFGARARLTLFHWSAAMRLPLALLVLLSLRFSLLISIRRSQITASAPSRATLLPQWRARWTVSRRLQRPSFL